MRKERQIEKSAGRMKIDECQKEVQSHASTNCTRWDFLFPISTSVGVSAWRSTSRSGLASPFLPRLMARGLFALLTDTDRAIPTGLFALLTDTERAIPIGPFGLLTETERAMPTGLFGLLTDTERAILMGLFALLTDMERAMPTVAVWIFGLLSLFFRWVLTVSTVSN